MIEISDIKDRDSLKTWLTEWPEQAGLDEEAAKALAGTIAHRCAMRVLPVWWRWSRTDAARQLDLTALPVLRSVLTSGVAVKIPTPDVRKAANAAATAATAAGNAAIDAANAANAAANAAFAATFAAFATFATSFAAFTATFACGRILGWTAHAREQIGEGRLVRPRSVYTGPVPEMA